MPNGFLLDLNRCTGCDACRLACTIENRLSPEVSWRDVHTFNDPRHPELPVYHLSLACNHCADAPCETACPALAISRDPVTDAVLLDADRCIGCGYCSWACPFDAPLYDERAGVMTKCTFCHPRLARGEAPACVAACPTNALDCRDTDTGGGVERVPGFPETQARPAMRFVPLTRPVRKPIDAPAADALEPCSKIGLRTEWPLVLFSLIAAWLVGWAGARVLAPVPSDPLVFLAVALVGAGASTLHLGRKLRAWRAVLNLRGSWLSREVVLYSAFTSVATLTLAAGPEGRLAYWPALALGLACLYSVDRVYDVVRASGEPRPHSADTLLTGVFLAAVIAFHPLLVLLTGAVKLFLYVIDGRAFTRFGALRIACGFVAPPLLALLGGSAWQAAILVCVAAGEIVDRCEFYTGLRVTTPRNQTVSDLRALLAASGPVYMR